MIDTTKVVREESGMIVSMETGKTGMKTHEPNTENTQKTHRKHTENRGFSFAIIKRKCDNFSHSNCYAIKHNRITSNSLHKGIKKTKSNPQRGRR